MIEKIMNKIKFKLRKWLEIDTLENAHNKYITSNELDKRYIKNLIGDNYNEENEKIDALNRTLQSIVSIGGDVVPNFNTDKNRSWAVVCIQGNYNIVKFIDLYGKDYREILNFLKQYECSRRVIDAPNNKMFEEMFIWK